MNSSRTRKIPAEPRALVSDANSADTSRPVGLAPVEPMPHGNA
ncbi:hypothetical protein HALLA_01535 (plasmid) [Halostagnicola larsenii XH-48]|uniref:Uncharacterized protein n=1 Tax=Halostagnicola larsenii XH-48 TaxID=797299 RepID=W0JTU5_9EURY|nr:hypothetical protein HALLA_01535 [Halostagnicola larsenii XH-48]